MQEEGRLSVQGVCSPFALIEAQRYAVREELESGSDSEDAAVMTPTKSPQAMPTVDEDPSKDPSPESYDDLRKAEGTIDGSWPHWQHCQRTAFNLMNPCDGLHAPNVGQGKTFEVHTSWLQHTTAYKWSKFQRDAVAPDTLLTLGMAEGSFAGGCPATAAIYAGRGQDRKEGRRRRGGRGRRGHDESSLETAHRKPANPKLADVIMPALKAKALAQSQAQDAQMSTQEAKGSPVRSAGAADSPSQGTKPGNDLTEDPRRCSQDCRCLNQDVCPG